MRTLLGIFWDTGIRLRCPVCEQGKLFKDWSRMHPTCPHCNVRFERYDGEVTGAMSISIVVTALLFFASYLGVYFLWDWPLWLELAVWVPFSVLFPILFYRYSRALWVAGLHLMGDVHWDREPYVETDLSILDAFLHRPEAAPPDPDSSPSPREED